jgi:hypothetical protein
MVKRGDLTKIDISGVQMFGLADEHQAHGSH